MAEFVKNPIDNIRNFFDLKFINILLHQILLFKPPHQF